MPSFFGHAAAGIALGAAFVDAKTPSRAWALGVLCALAPDLDWFTVFLRVHPGNFLAHRGITHSLLGATLLAVGAFLCGFWSDLRRPRILTYLLLASLSHGLLDACTSGRIGVAFFYPFSTTRWGCYWQPFMDAPLPFWSGLRRPFLGSLLGQALWIGVPGLIWMAGIRVLRRASAWMPLPEIESEG